MFNFQNKPVGGVIPVSFQNPNFNPRFRFQSIPSCKLNPKLKFWKIDLHIVIREFPQSGFDKQPDS